MSFPSNTSSWMSSYSFSELLLEGEVKVVTVTTVLSLQTPNEYINLLLFGVDNPMFATWYLISKNYLVSCKWLKFVWCNTYKIGICFNHNKNVFWNIFSFFCTILRLTIHNKNWVIFTLFCQHKKICCHQFFTFFFHSHFLSFL